jgi:hypothetical protein
MKFTVVWLPSALNHLAALWNNSADRGSITTAADRIDQLLAMDPRTKGEAREANTRILIVPPLAVYFTVQEMDRLVTVYAVWSWTT